MYKVKFIGVTNFKSKAGNDCYVVHTWDDNNSKIVDIFVDQGIYNVCESMDMGEDVELCGTINKYGRPALTINI